MKKIDGDLCVSKEELYIISRGLIEFSQEMYWSFSTNVKLHKKFEKKFKFSLIELEYVEDNIGDLELNLRGVNIEDIMLSFSDNSNLKKKFIIYTALNECSKNFEDYEISIRSGITKKELDKVLNDYKATFPEILDYKAINKD